MVKVESIEKLLAEHQFFKDMPDYVLKTVVGCGKNERYEAGDFIAHEGEKADKFYLIRTGTVALEFHVGNEDIVVETQHAGEVVGWSWLVEPYVWSCDLRATELTRVISLDAACLRKKMKKDSAFGFDLYSRFAPLIAHRLHHAHQQLTDMYASNAKAK